VADLALVPAPLMCLFPAAAPARILHVEDGRVHRRIRELVVLPSVCDDDDRRGVVPRANTVASMFETLAAALTGRQRESESALGGADLDGAEGVP
jgi:hypothetical protein